MSQSMATFANRDVSWLAVYVAELTLALGDVARILGGVSAPTSAQRLLLCAEASQPLKTNYPSRLNLWISHQAHGLEPQYFPRNNHSDKIAMRAKKKCWFT